MNRKQLGWVLVLLIIVGGLGLVVYRQTSSQWNGAPAGSGGRVLAPFDLNAVERITLKTAADSATLEKREGEWIVADRGYAADFLQIRELIQKLWELKPVQQMKAEPSQYGRLELKTPDSGDTNETGLEAVFFGEDGKELARLLLGKVFMKKSPQFPDSEGFPAGRYVMSPHREGEVALVDEALTSIKAVPEEWLDKRFVEISGVERVKLQGTTPELSWEMERRENEWRSPGLKENEKLDASKVPGFDAILGRLEILDVEPADAQAPEIRQRLEVQTGDGFHYTFGLAQVKGERQPVTVEITADLPEERTPAADEKPEDKQRLDAAFTEKRKRLEKKLEEEKKLEGRVFLISANALAPLLVALNDFVAEPPALTPSPDASETE